MSGRTGQPLLSVRDLRVAFGTKRSVAQAVGGISYDLWPGETLGIVGESGSGKSVSSLALMGLVPQPPGSISGEVRLGGREILGSSETEWQRIRGNEIAMIFQDPLTALNPVLTIGRQLTEGMELHLGLDAKAAEERAVELLDLVGIPAPRKRLRDYPHQLSGGMRQRVMIAIGLACEPSVLIADEPTTALDVTIQAQIVDLVQRLQDQLGTAVIWITHDLGVVAGLADRIVVMYGGRVVEEAGTDALYANPQHPYTQGLLGSLPVVGVERPDELVAIPGMPPDPTALPEGCAFYPRCPHRDDPRCASEVPPLRDVQGGPSDDGMPHRVATFYEVGR